jgi:hypothetical protein
LHSCPDQVDSAKLVCSGVLLVALGCSESTPTGSSKVGSENVRVVVGPNAVGSDATGLQWGVSWTVFLDAGTPSTDAPADGGTFLRGLATPVSVTEVSSTIAGPDGHVLATFVTSASQIAAQNFIAINTGTSQVTSDRGLVVSQGGLYDINSPSPTSQATIAVRLTDGNNQVHEVRIANEIRQERLLPTACTRGQPSSGVRISPTGFEAFGADPILGFCLAFVNQDAVAHDIRSDPHPDHSSCPALNIGLVPAGATRTSLGINTWGTCGYHDELTPGDERFQGHLVIQPPRSQ